MKKIGLALSGGGYRAAAFHIGTLNKLQEMKILKEVDVLSTISGGSITGACYCLSKERYTDFSQKMVSLLASKSVIKKILTSFTFIKAALFVLVFLAAAIFVLFTKVAFLSPVILAVMMIILVTFQFRIFPVSKVIQKAYDSFFYDNATLKNFNEKPEIVIGSTNLQTSRPFIFSRLRMEDSFYSNYSDGEEPICFRHDDFPVSKAVTASSCVPFAFSPIDIEKKYFADPGDFKKVKPQLVDGGVYDNQGIHKITQDNSRLNCHFIIISDAGNRLPFERSYNNTFNLLLRTVNVFMTRIKNFQMVQNVYRNSKYSNREVAYLSLGWDLEDCIPGFVDNLIENNVTTDVIKAHNIPEEWLLDPAKHKPDLIGLLEYEVGYDQIFRRNLDSDDMDIARSVGTNLTRLSKKQIDCLIRHAENLTELQVKLYCPSLKVCQEGELVR